MIHHTSVGSSEVNFSRIAVLACCGALIGFTVGCLIELFVSMFNGMLYSAGVPDFLAQFPNENLGALVERIVYTLLGVVCSLASLLFSCESFSLARATLIHMTVITISLITAGIYLHWIHFGKEIFGFLAISMVIYFLIWFSIWLNIRSQIRSMNTKLNSQA